MVADQVGGDVQRCHSGTSNQAQFCAYFRFNPWSKRLVLNPCFDKLSKWRDVIRCFSYRARKSPCALLYCTCTHVRDFLTTMCSQMKLDCACFYIDFGHSEEALRKLFAAHFPHLRDFRWPRLPAAAWLHSSSTEVSYNQCRSGLFDGAVCV